jgi:taurine dioxygenase
LRVRKLAPALGASIDGIDLSRPLDDASARLVREALYEHEVIFFRDQQLSPALQVALARLFGEPERTRHPKFDCVEGQPEVAIVINDDARPPDIDVWHTDMTFIEQPPAACVLYCIECPASGGDTLWASLSSAYRALTPSLQTLLQNYSARHALRLDDIPMQQIQKLGDRVISASHPVIRRHPASGRLCLFVNSVYTRSIDGLAEPESRHLLAMLFEISQRPEHQARFHWTPGSVAIWDNRCTQHYAIADYFPQRRVMHRVAVVGDRPLGPL